MVKNDYKREVRSEFEMKQIFREEVADFKILKILKDEHYFLRLKSWTVAMSSK